MKECEGLMLVKDGNFHGVCTAITWLPHCWNIMLNIGQKLAVHHFCPDTHGVVTKSGGVYLLVGII